MENNNVTFIPTELLTSVDISLKAKGLYGYMALHKNDYDYLTIRNLAAVLKDGTTAIHSSLKELKASGWVSYSKKSNGKGIYSVHEYPIVVLGATDNKFVLSREFETAIYLMVDRHTDLYKIGRSINPVHREKTLLSQAPMIELLLYFEANNSTEDMLHEHFKDKRRRGEWFKLVQSDVELIKRYGRNKNLIEI
jgi:hypothetical protein